MKTEQDDDTPTITQGELFWRGAACASVGFTLYLADAYFHRSTDPFVDVGRLADVATVLVAGSAFWTVVFDLKLLKWFMRRVRRLYIEIKEYMEHTRQSGGERSETSERSETVASPLDDVQSQAVGIRKAKPSPSPIFGIIVLVVLAGALVFPPMCTSSSKKPDATESGEGPMNGAVPAGEGAPQESDETPSPTLLDDESSRELPRDECLYVVQPGDFCWTIAESYGVEPYPAWLNIARLNGIRSSIDGNDCPIKAGTELRLPNEWCQ